MGSFLGEAFAQGKVLTGGIQTQVMCCEAGQVLGYVYEFKNNRRYPVSGALISVPDVAMTAQSDENGQFLLNGLPTKAPLILNITKSGYLPHNTIIKKETLLEAGRDPMTFTLEAQHTRTLVIDDGLHHLGDGHYSGRSASAKSFRQYNSEGTVLRRSFTLQTLRPGSGSSPPSQPMLHIGAVLGLDTAQAHTVENSELRHSASPLLVRLNHQLIGEITLNGTQHRLPLPVGLLNLGGPNLLELEAGYQKPDGLRTDYDDMELMNLWVSY